MKLSNVSYLVMSACAAALLALAPASASAQFVEVAAGTSLADPGNGQGVAWGDYDNDGDLDLYIANGGANKLLRNDGGTFADATSGPLGDMGSGYGVAWGDYDDDGDLDLYVANDGANKLLRNEGGGSFVDATGASPLADAGSGSGVAWGDYDNDGDLDLYLANFGSPNKLFRNDGGGTFVDVAAGTPLADNGNGIGVAWGDYDGDGDLDLYLANGGSANKLFRNDGGGSFADATGGTPLGDAGNGQGVAWGDYDNDGDLDLYLVNSGNANKLFRNEGGGSFADATGGTPLGDTGLGQGVAWGDYDNDGDLDLYLSNLITANRLFRNDGSGTFVDVAAGTPLADAANGTGVAWGDYDGDGDLDLYLANAGQANKLFRSDAAAGQHWLQVKLRGAVSNSAGIGAWVRVVAGGVSMIREISGGSGYCSQDAMVASFGLGATATVDSLIVTWPSGIVQVVSPVPTANTAQTVREPGFFEDVAAGTPLAAPGNGSGVAWGDYDNDGYVDLYLTRIGEANQLLHNEGNNTFVDATAGTPLGDTGSGFSAVWGDYDHDGDLDLYLANGSSTSLTNRLFQNQGGGAFVDVTTTASSIPNLLADPGGSGRGVGWADYDNDGDLDLYLANSNSANKLFRNGGNGTFSDVPGGPLADGGVGNGVAWGDYDNDGDLDLYLANAGQANKLFRNEGGGTFVDATSGPLGDTGGGYGVAWGDYDNDGDLDLYLANAGTENRLFRNDEGSWVDVAVGTPLADAGNGRGVAWGDYDNDGDLDLYLANSGSANRLFRNEGGDVFSEVAGGTQLADTGSGQGVAWGDADNDGDLDLYLANQGQPNRLFRNDVAAGQHWLQVQLVGTASNRDGLGARVRVVAEGASRIRDISAGSGFCSQDAMVASFGLGAATTVDSLIVRWPSGRVQRVLPAPAVDQMLQVVEDTDIQDVAAGTPLGDTGSGRAMAWGDYDNDGDLDLYLANSGQANKLFRNDGGGTFTDATSGPLGDTGYGRGVAWGDYDNDGDLDLYLSNDGQANKLFRNDGGGAFVDVTGVSPLGDTGWGYGVAWGDYDNDGDLDLYLANVGSANKLFRNDGGGGFADATGGTPLGDAGYGQGVAWGDYDDDGDLDLYLANYGQANKLFRNDGDGTFVDATSGQLANTGSGTGVAWGDYDNDGDLDLFLANSGEANKLFRNDGDGDFFDATGLALPPGDSGSCHGVAWGDYDNDGDLDLYLANVGSANKLLRNDGGTFLDATALVPPLGDAGNGFGVAWGDYDNDGDLDLYLANSGQANKLFRNDAAENQHWLQVKLEGTRSNRAGIGARVRVVAGGSSQIREISGGSGYCSQDAMVASFGLGAAATIDSLIVHWPSGVVQAVSPAPSVDGALLVVESGFYDLAAGLEGVRRGAAAWGDYDNDGDLDILLTGYSASNVPISRVYNNDGGVFTDIAAGLAGVWQGAAAWGDYDNDGDLDLLLTGTDADFVRVARIYNNDGGVFTDIAASLEGVIFSSVAWGDYDSDGDLDILLAGRTASVVNISRIYRNDAGTFVDVAAGLEGVEFSSVAWGDYDSDGDLDILLAGRTASGVTISRIYGNDDGTFTDTGAGLVGVYLSAVAWGDCDNDGDLDILLTGYRASNVHIARIYENTTGSANTIPSAPANLGASLSGGIATFTWDAGSDNETPAAGLSYNLRVGTTPGGSELSAAMADSASGYRRLPAGGNAQQRLSWSLDFSAVAPDATLYWSVQTVDTGFAGSAFAAEQSLEPGSVSAVAELPTRFALHPNYPNPFNPSTTLRFDLPQAGKVELTIYDTAGRRVRTLVRETLAAGRQEVVWRGRDDGGRQVASGVYFYRLEAGTFGETKKMILLK
ncbi:MAG: VCBS repeat-containing protein [Krumholzibacteria bacterium]|nr:VCBS repeat-containing protein [Candidatus Krumholzibacteria bacterium]